MCICVCFDRYDEVYSMFKIFVVFYLLPSGNQSRVPGKSPSSFMILSP